MGASEATGKAAEGAGKAPLRARLREAREALGEGERARVDGLIAAQVRAHPAWKAAEVVFAYVSVGAEVDTRGLIRSAWKEGKRVAVPRVVPGTRLMEWYELRGFDELERGAFGLEEPRADPARLMTVPQKAETGTGAGAEVSAGAGAPGAGADVDADGSGFAGGRAEARPYKETAGAAAGVSGAGAEVSAGGSGFAGGRAEARPYRETADATAGAPSACVADGDATAGEAAAEDDAGCGGRLRAVALVPGYAFDREGFRLGYGGGFYDRFLSAFDGVSLGLCRAAFLFDDPLPRNPTDLPVDVVVTEKG